MPNHKHGASISSIGGHEHLLFKNEYATFNNAQTDITANTSVSAATHSSRGEAYAMLAGSSDADSGRSSFATGTSQIISINNTGGGNKANNMQPYIAVNHWHRKA